MINILRRVVSSGGAWEMAGTTAGLCGCGCIAAQVWRECSSRGASSLSIGYVVGFLAIFAFWTAYGVRFSRPALWLTNGIGTGLQAALLIVILLKH